MRAILLTITGAVLLLVPMVVIALALTPQECDALAQWVYDQAKIRDSKEVTRKEHEDATRYANSERHGVDIVEMLMRELGKVYDQAKEPLMAGSDARYECYAKQGRMGVEARR